MGTCKPVVARTTIRSICGRANLDFESTAVGSDGAERGTLACSAVTASSSSPLSPERPAVDLPLAITPETVSLSNAHKCFRRSNPHPGGLTLR